MKDESVISELLDIPFKEFMPGQVIQSQQFNDDMKDIEGKINEIIEGHNNLCDDSYLHIENKENPHSVSPHQIGTYNAEEIDYMIEDVKSGNLNDFSIENRVLSDDCIENRNLAVGCVTNSKVDPEFGSQVNIENNMSIKNRYTKSETDKLVFDLVGEGTYTREEIDSKFEEYQAGAIVDKTIGVEKLKNDVGALLDISNNNTILNMYTSDEVDYLISEYGTCRDWGSITEGDNPPPLKVPVESIVLDKNNHTFKTLGDSLTLTPTILPQNATNKSVRWVSSSPGVATVLNGIVTSINDGSCIVSCITNDGDKVANCNIIVDSYVAPTYELTVTPGTYTGVKNEIAYINGTCTYPNVHYFEVSSDDGWVGVANNFRNGKFELELPEFLSVKTYRNCTLEARTKDDKVIAIANGKFDLIVTEGDTTVSVIGVKVEPTSVTINVGETVQLNASIVPSNATNKNVTWSSSSPSIAEVGYSGVVTAYSVGETTITATTEDGSFKATCTVNITQDSAGGDGIIVNPTSFTVKKGDMLEIPATIDINEQYPTWELWKDNSYLTGITKASGEDKFLLYNTNALALGVNSNLQIICLKWGSDSYIEIGRSNTFSITTNDGSGGGEPEPEPPIEPTAKMYHSVAYTLKPWESGYTLLDGLEMFKNYNYGSALICLPVDCSFSNDSPFCDVTESLINIACNKVESLGLEPILKMHTVSLQEDGQGNVDKPTNAQTWFNNYRTLVNKYADIVVKKGYKEFIISNEMHNVMNLASNKQYMTPIIADVKAKGLKVSMAMNLPEVKENDGFQYYDELDFYCMNTYPQLTRNGVAWGRDNFEQLREGFYTPISSMDTDYGALFESMGGQNNLHKEIWLTEVGCINRERGLEYPAYWGGSDARNDEAQELWLKAVFDVLENDKKSGKLTNRVTRYMLWDGNSDSDFNPTNKRGKVVLDTYWKDEEGEVEPPPPTPDEDMNYFEIGNPTLQSNYRSSHVVDIPNNKVTVTSPNEGGIDGYVMCELPDIRYGRRYKVSCTTNDARSFIRVKVDNGTIITQDKGTKYEFEFDGQDAKTKVIKLEFGIRYRDSGNTAPIIVDFNDIKIIDVNGDPPPEESDGITYDVVDYKIIVSDGVNTESYHSCDDIPRNHTSGNGGVDGYKIIIKNGVKHYLSLTKGSSPSKITIDGMKPFNYTYIDQDFKGKWSNRAYAVKNNTLKYTIANRIDNDEYESHTTDDRTINPDSLTRALKIYNSAIPEYMQITQDQNSINSVSEGYFNTEWLGICRLNQGEKFHIHQNTRLLGGFGNSTRFYVAILVHELGHTTGIWDNSPHYPTTYTYNKNQENEWLQPSDIAHIKDKFPHLTGGSARTNKCELTTNDNDVVFSFRHFKDEREMFDSAHSVIVASFIGEDDKTTNIYNLNYKTYNFKITSTSKGSKQINEVISIMEHESYDLGLVPNSEYKMYLGDFDFLLNPKECIIKI